MSLPVPLRFSGSPGSPYTRKMLALLRYRRIPHQLLIQGFRPRGDLPKPKVQLQPTFYLPGADGELEAVVDSTPLIRRFEAEFSERAVVPPDPALAFIDYLLEDFADEWLTKAMFHYRWFYDADIEKGGEILPRWSVEPMPEEMLGQIKKTIQDRQTSRLYVVGSNDTTAPVIEASYVRILDALKKLFEQQSFLMGGRPGACDFAHYAQLTQLAKFDPTPAALTLEHAPRVYAWVDVMDDLSGHEASDADWIPRDQVRERLGELLAEVGRVYAPFMVANAQALTSGADEVKTTIDGQTWTQKPFPYQGRCVQWLHQQYAALADADRKAVDQILAGTGAEQLFSS